MNQLEAFEIKAFTFYTMTGYLAPGKDVGAAAASTTYDAERNAAWKVWDRAYGNCVAETIHAASKVMDDE